MNNNEPLDAKEWTIMILLGIILILAFSYPSSHEQYLEYNGLTHSEDI